MSDDEETTDPQGGDPARVWVWKSKFDAMERGFNMAVESLEVIAEDEKELTGESRRLAKTCGLIAALHQKSRPGGD